MHWEKRNETTRPATPKPLITELCNAGMGEAPFLQVVHAVPRGWTAWLQFWPVPTSGITGEVVRHSALAACQAAQLSWARGLL